jgi:flagellar L-ring protein precursor FlgH
MIMNGRTSRRNVSLLMVLGGLLVSCGPAHIAPYTPKVREPPPMAEGPAAGAPSSSGSLFQPGVVGAGLFVDARAYRINDVVVVRVEEVADAERSAATDTSHNSWAGGGLSGLPIIGPLLAPLLPGVPIPNVDLEAGMTAGNTFEGRGQTGRTERLVATVSTVVKSVMPNGNLFVEGHRVVLVNREEQHLYVSGVVRPIDIDDENTIDSSRIAEAHIEFVGQGVVSDAESPGIVTRTGGFLWPF